MATASLPQTVSEAATHIIANGTVIQVPLRAFASLAGFRAWATSNACPDHIRVAYIEGEVYLDVSNEELVTHVLVKTEINRVLSTLVLEQDTGMFFGDGGLVSNKSADVSNNPDAVFLSWDTIESKRASLVPRAARPGTFREIIGTPDWILEIVSDSSIHKDTKRLRDAYHKAGIPEYWLVDARGDEVVFQILTWKTSGYVAAARRGGWQKSRTYSCSFRLDRHRNRVGHWAYRLHVR